MERAIKLYARPVRGTLAVLVTIRMIQELDWKRKDDEVDDCS